MLAGAGASAHPGVVAGRRPPRRAVREEASVNEPYTGGVSWHKSTFSSDGSGNCVEVALLGETVLVRNSRHPGGVVLSFTLAEWGAFLAGVRNGEFELPR